jgi:hypothetical protein
MNIKNYGGLIEKSFGAELNPKEIEIYKNYSASIRKMIESSKPGVG